jgi:hypothetical protein
MTTLTVGSASTSTVANAGSYWTPQQLQNATAYVASLPNTSSEGLTTVTEIEVPKEEDSFYVNTETEEALMVLAGGKDKALTTGRCLLCSNELAFNIRISILENGSLSSYGESEYWILTLCPKCKVVYDRKRFRTHVIQQPPIQDNAWRPYPYTGNTPWITTTTSTSLPWDVEYTPNLPSVGTNVSTDEFKNTVLKWYTK